MLHFCMFASIKWLDKIQLPGLDVFSKKIIRNRRLRRPLDKSQLNEDEGEN